jgi:hypothetical protein
MPMAALPPKTAIDAELKAALTQNWRQTIKSS